MTKQAYWQHQAQAAQQAGQDENTFVAHTTAEHRYEAVRAWRIIERQRTAASR